MKKIAGIWAGLLLAVFGSSQELIRNPAKPLNPDYGRVLKLEMVFDKDFYNKHNPPKKDSKKEENILVRKYKILKG